VTVSIMYVAPDQVTVSQNPGTGKTTLRRARKAPRRTTQHLVTAELADEQSGQVVETITATPEDPCYVQGQGFQPLGSLGIGTSIVTPAERETSPGRTHPLRFGTRNTGQRGTLGGGGGKRHHGEHTATIPPLQAGEPPLPRAR
jgi:hypothetical protein